MFLLDGFLPLHHCAHSLSLLYNFLTYVSLQILHNCIFHKLILLIHVNRKYRTNWFNDLEIFLFFIYSEIIIGIEVLGSIAFTVKILDVGAEIVNFFLKICNFFLLRQRKLAFICGSQILNLIAWVLSVFFLNIFFFSTKIIFFL